MRTAAFSASPMQNGFLLREKRWAYIQYGEHGERGRELFDLDADPKQYVNLAGLKEHAATVAEFEKKMTAKLKAVRTNDL